MQYLGCYLGANLNVDETPKKINTNRQILYKQNKFLKPKLRRLLCNSLIQAHFDYACFCLYPLVRQQISRKIQVTQIQNVSVFSQNLPKSIV